MSNPITKIKIPTQSEFLNIKWYILILIILYLLLISTAELVYLAVRRMKLALLDTVA